MDMKQIEYVIEISKSGSFNKAADALYMSQPNLSVSIKKLEYELGVPLFIRRSTGIELSAFGIQFLEHAKPLYLDFLRLENLSKNDEFLHREMLSVSSFPLKFAYQEFMKLHLSCSARDVAFFHHEHNNVDAVIDDLMMQRAKIGIVVFSSLQKKSMKRLFSIYNLKYTFLSHERPFFLVGQNHPLYHTDREELSLEALREYPYISIYEGWFRGVSPDSLLHHIIEHSNIKVASRACLYELLKDSNAFSISTNNQSAYLTEPAYDYIKAIPIQQPEFDFEIGFLRLDSHTPTAVEKEFMQRIFQVVHQASC